jgi:hypothetical protein
MNEKEQLKQVIDRLPDYKLAYVAKLIMNIEKTYIEEIEPDEWDLEMIAHAKKVNDGNGIPIETLASELGVKL